MLLLYTNRVWANFRILQEEKIFWVCFFGFELKIVFHWKFQLFILFKSSLKYFARESLSCITENRDVSSETSLGFETKLSEMFKKSNGSRIEPLGTPTAKMTYTERWLFRITLWFFPFRKSVKGFSKLPASVRQALA